MNFFFEFLKRLHVNHADEYNFLYILIFNITKSRNSYVEYCQIANKHGNHFRAAMTSISIFAFIIFPYLEAVDTRYVCITMERATISMRLFTQSRKCELFENEKFIKQLGD